MFRHVNSASAAILSTVVLVVVVVVHVVVDVSCCFFWLLWLFLWRIKERSCICRQIATGNCAVKHNPRGESLCSPCVTVNQSLSARFRILPPFGPWILPEYYIEASSTDVYES